MSATLLRYNQISYLGRYLPYRRCLPMPIDTYYCTVRYKHLTISDKQHLKAQGHLTTQPYNYRYLGIYPTFYGAYRVRSKDHSREAKDVHIHHNPVRPPAWRFCTFPSTRPGRCFSEYISFFPAYSTCCGVLAKIRSPFSDPSPSPSCPPCSGRITVGPSIVPHFPRLYFHYCTQDSSWLRMGCFAAG